MNSPKTSPSSDALPDSLNAFSASKKRRWDETSEASRSCQVTGALPWDSYLEMSRIGSTSSVHFHYFIFSPSHQKIRSLCPISPPFASSSCLQEEGHVGRSQGSHRKELAIKVLAAELDRSMETWLREKDCVTRAEVGSIRYGELL